MKTFLFMTNSDWSEELNICLADELDEVLKGWDDQIAQGAQDAAAEHNYIARMDGGEEVTVEEVAEKMRDDLRRSWFVPSDEDLGDFLSESGTRRYTASDAAEAEIERLRNFCGAFSEGGPVSHREAEMFTRTNWAHYLDKTELVEMQAGIQGWVNDDGDLYYGAYEGDEDDIENIQKCLDWLDEAPGNQVLHMKDEDGHWFLRVLPEEE